MEFDKIIERKLSLVDISTGLETDLCIEIGRPQWSEINVEAVCPVLISGLMNSSLDIYGSDLLSALECALSFVNSELKNVPPDRKVVWPGGEAYFD